MLNERGKGTRFLSQGSPVFGGSAYAQETSEVHALASLPGECNGMPL